MSIVVYTYSDPYRLKEESYWDEIKACPYFCAAQTLVNGLKYLYREDFVQGRVTTVKNFLEELFPHCQSAACRIKQHAAIDRAIAEGVSSGLGAEEQEKIRAALLWNREEVMESIRVMFELGVDVEEIREDMLTPAQKVIARPCGTCRDERQAPYHHVRHRAQGGSGDGESDGAAGLRCGYRRPEPSGRVAKEKILEKLLANTLLVSLMHVNNETGVIQPVEELGAELEKREILFHVDATQSCGKLVDELRRLKYRMLSFSAHKMRGPQGIGVLVLKKRDYKLPPVKAILYGGEQERGIRPGTIPAALAAGCGKACELAAMRYKEDSRKLQQIEAMLLQMIDEAGLAYSVNGDAEFSLPSTLNLALHGVSAEALMITARGGCAISNGSACTSKSYVPSYVLAAMGVSAEQIESSIRLSWGAETDEALLKTEFAKLLTAAKRLA